MKSYLLILLCMITFDKNLMAQDEMIKPVQNVIYGRPLSPLMGHVDAGYER